MSQHLTSLIDRYLHPDQIVFGHLFNPNAKSPHHYEMSNSTTETQQPNQLIIYKKQMSQTKIKSMLNMMQGNHQPLFKSSVLPKTKHLNSYRNESGEESFCEEDDDYQDYDDQMMLMEKDYEDQFGEEYDDEENPIMAMGNPISALAQMKNYARDFNYLPNAGMKHKGHNPMLFKSQQPTSTIKEEGLGAALAQKQYLENLKKTTITSKSKAQTKTKDNKQPQNQSEEDWQTDSQDDGAEFQDYTKK